MTPNGSKIGNVRFTAIKPRGRLLGFCSFVYDDSFFIGNISVLKREDGNGIFLAYPDTVLPTGTIFKIAHPVKREVSDAVMKAISPLVFEEMGKMAKMFDDNTPSLSRKHRP